MWRGWYSVERSTRCLPELEHSSVRQAWSPAMCRATTSSSSWDRQKREEHLTIVESETADKRRTVHGEPPEVRGERDWPNGQPKFGISAQKVGWRPGLLQSPSDI